MLRQRTSSRNNAALCIQSSHHRILCSIYLLKRMRGEGKEMEERIREKSSPILLRSSEKKKGEAAIPFKLWFVITYCASGDGCQWCHDFEKKVFQNHWRRNFSNEASFQTFIVSTFTAVTKLPSSSLGCWCEKRRGNVVAIAIRMCKGKAFKAVKELKES